MGLGIFIAGAAVFFGTHLFTSFRKRGPGDIAERMGRRYMGLYSLVSLAGFALLIWGYAMMRPGEAHVWDAPPWTRHLVLAMMFPTLVLLVSSYAPTGYIKKWVGHPMLTAVLLWATVHLAANGDFAEVLLFGAFLAYAVIDRIALVVRSDRGAARAKPNILGDMIAISGGGAAYLAVAFWLHSLLIGVPVA
jgi:uncharacterized membrane protein